MSIYKIIEELRATSSRNAKEAILTKHKDNELLKEFFYMSLNPYMNFYQKKIPAYKTNWDESFIPLDCAMNNIADKLSTRTITGNAAIDYLTKQLSLLSPDDAKVLVAIIEKDPDCGVSDATVNKIWPGHIPSFPVMLCSPFEQKLVERLHWKKGVYAQLKSDGMRCMLLVNDGAVTAYSRNGRVLETHGVFDYLGKIGKNFVIDGELLVRNDKGGFLDRKTGNGICNRALKSTVTKVQAEMFYLNAWDYIPMEDFQKGLCVDAYNIRFVNLQGIVGDIRYFTDNINIGLIETQTIHTLEEAQSIFEAYLEKGEEGLILKDKTAIWEDTRSKQLIKMKAERDADLLCVDIVPGTGKYEGKIGSLICKSSDGLVEVNVGSGLTDADREQDHKKFLGKIIEVVYNEKIKAKDGTFSLFLPRFVTVREDKDVANSIKELK